MMKIKKKEWKQPALMVIARTYDVLGGGIPGYKESTILGSQNGANPITFTIPAGKGGHAYSRAYTKNHYLS